MTDAESNEAGADGGAGGKATAKRVAPGRVQRLVNISLLASAALVLSYLESMVPLPVTLPGVKLGLGNVAVAVALFALGPRAAGGVAVAKALASGLLFGSPVMLAYSLGGTALAFCAMVFFQRVVGAGPLAVCMVAAVFHNVGQIAVAAALLGNASVLLSLPPLAVAACVTGALTGAAASAALAPLCGMPHASGGISRLMASLAKRAPKPKGAEQSAARSENRGAPRTGFGVFRPGGSLAHRLDPRAKILFALLYLAAAYLANSPAALAMVFAAAAAMLFAAAASWSSLRAALRPFFWLVAFIVVFDALFMKSGAVLWQCGAVCISAGGLAYGLEQALRFCCVLLATSTLMSTTSPTALTDGFAALLAPLRKTGAHVDSAALVMGLTLRFIPVFSEELHKLRRAQAARGANFESGGFVHRVLALQPLITPLLAGALRRSDALATSIESRAFGAARARSCLREYRMAARDWASIGLAALLLAACALL